MIPRLPLWPILAQTGPAQQATPVHVHPLNQISENLNGDSLISMHWLLLAAGLVMLLLSAVSLMQWWKHRHEHTHPWMTFISTAGFAGLGWRHQWTLLWIARRQKLTSPISLMLAPGTFDQHVKAYLDSRPGFRRESIRRTTQDIRELLFGDAVRQ